MIPVQIDTEQFRALCVTDGLVFTSKTEDVGDFVRIHHPYFVQFDAEDSDTIDFAMMDPWNPEDFLDISKSKIEFTTRLNEVYTQIFRKVVFSRLGADSPSGGPSKDGDSKVGLINRKSMH